MKTSSINIVGAYCHLSTAILAVAIAFTHVFSQEAASVQVVANINATVTIEPSDCPAGSVGDTLAVSAGQQATLALTLGSDGTPILRGTSMQTGTSATYQLFSLGGKRLDISRQNIPQGIYFISVSENGKTYTSKVAHLGGKFNLSSASGGRYSIPSVLAKNGVCTWTLTATAAGYEDVSYDIAPAPVAGASNAVQTITFNIPSSSSESVVVEPSSSSAEEPVVVPSSSDAAHCGINPQTYDPATYECKEGKNGIYLKNGFTDSRDNDKHYDAVLIGSKVWMAKNLNYNADNSKCYGDNSGGDSQNRCGTYGRLYNWSTAKTACPQGWHLPDNAEWNALMRTVNPSCSDNTSCTGATKLKADTLWGSYENIPVGTDNYGFSALPGGYGNLSGGFVDVGGYGGWWSSTGLSDQSAYFRSMYNNHDYVNYIGANKSQLYSVRCVKD